MAGSWVVVCGLDEPMGNLVVYGPFDTREAAWEWEGGAHSTGYENAEPQAYCGNLVSHDYHDVVPMTNKEDN